MRTFARREFKTYGKTLIGLLFNIGFLITLERWCLSRTKWSEERSWARISAVYLTGTQPEAPVASRFRKIVNLAKRIDYESVFGVITAILIWVGFLAALW